MGELLVSSGERSGDRLIRPFLGPMLASGHRCTGLVGRELEALGVDGVFDQSRVSATGLTEAFGALYPTVSCYRRLKSRLKQSDALLLSDFPEVNLRLSRVARQRKLPVAYLAPPQAWAWREWRYRELLPINFVGCLFPFTTEWFRRRGVRAHWVGHPLANACPGIGKSSQLVTLMPGSRLRTVRSILPAMVQLVDALSLAEPTIEVCLVLANDIRLFDVREQLKPRCARISISRDVDGMLSESAMTIAHPGTATLHAVLRGSPVLTICNPSRLTRAVGRRLIKARHLALPNLLLNRSVFPEFVVGETRLDESLLSARRLLEHRNGLEESFSEVWSHCRVDDPNRLYAQVLDTLFG